MTVRAGSPALGGAICVKKELVNVFISHYTTNRKKINQYLRIEYSLYAAKIYIR